MSNSADSARSMELKSTNAVIDAPNPPFLPMSGSGEAPTCCDKISRIVFIGIIGLLVCAGVAALVGGASLEKSISGLPFQHCLIFESIGVAAIAGGSVAAVAGIAVFVFLILRDSTVGMIFADGSHPAWKALRFFGWFATPFVFALVLIALATGSITLFTLSLQIPGLNTNYVSVRGITSAVSISRDDSGLVHISANTIEDALFGQGFAQAQDRLWQLEFQRLAAKGRLSEFVGTSALDVDKQVRTLNFASAAIQMCSNLTAEENSKLRAYVGGVNYYLANVKQRPPEFMFMSERLLFFHEPEPFEVVDVCLAAKLLQWQLSLNIASEAERFNIFWRTNRTYDQIEELYVNQTNISHTVLNAKQMGFSEADAQAGRQRERQDYLVEKGLYDTYMTQLRQNLTGNRRIPTPPAQQRANKLGFDILRLKQLHASNAWSARTSGDGTQAAHGASDPHLTINLPSVWYYTHLTVKWNSTLTMDYSGVGMVGIPGCQIGKTNFVSWGITMSLTDLEDLFLMVPDPSRPATHYMYNGTARAYTYRTETIKVKDDSDFVLTVRESVIGPVVSDIFNNQLPSELAFCVSAIPLQADTTSVTGILNLLSPNMTTVMDFRDMAMGLFQSPGLSIASQDHLGNLGYCMTASHPYRAVGHTGKYPSLGDGTYAYRGRIPYNKLPTLIIPAATSNTDPSFFGVANQKIYPDGYEYSLGYDYCYPWRGGRIQDLLERNPLNLSTAAFHMEVQRDTYSNIWDQFRAVLANTSTGTVGDNFNGSLSASGRAWLTRLLAWDGRSSMGAVEPSFFFLWLRSLNAVPQDVIQAAKAASSDAQSYWYADRTYSLTLLTNPTATMTAQCGLLTSPPGRSCLQYAADQFSSLAATSVSQQWGIDINQLTGAHLMMHKTILACLFERTYNKDGDFSTVDVADFSSSQDKMKPDAASSMRQLYDWSKPNTVSFALPGGESGNPYSAWYENLFVSFSADNYANVTVVGQPPSFSTTQLLLP